MGEGREGRPRQSRIFRVLFGGWITANRRRQPRFRTAQHVDSKHTPHGVRPKEDSCSRSGERLNPVNRLASPLDKKSRKTQKTFPPFPRLYPLLFELIRRLLDESHVGLPVACVGAGLSQTAPD